MRLLLYNIEYYNHTVSFEEEYCVTNNQFDTIGEISNLVVKNKLPYLYELNY